MLYSLFRGKGSGKQFCCYLLTNMADQPTDNPKHSLAIDLNRRQFLQSIGFVAGAGIAFKDELLRHPKQIEAAQPQQFAQAMQTRDSIANIWGDRTPHRGKWKVRVDQRTLAEPDRWVQSACVLCSYGCALDIGVKDNKIVGVRGRGNDRVNHGRLGQKGLHGWIANSSQDRLTTPLIRCNGSLQPASWDEAMSLIVQRSKDILTNYDRNAILFYNSGQLFLEEYYTLGVIGKGGIGTRNMDANTRLCTATASFALRESFGTDGVPGSYRVWVQ